MKRARNVKMKTFKKQWLCQKRPIKECWESTGRGPVAAKWGDPECRWRLVAKKIKMDKIETIEIVSTTCRKGFQVQVAPDCVVTGSKPRGP